MADSSRRFNSPVCIPRPIIIWLATGTYPRSQPLLLPSAQTKSLSQDQRQQQSWKHRRKTIKGRSRRHRSALKGIKSSRRTAIQLMVISKHKCGTLHQHQLPNKTRSQRQIKPLERRCLAFQLQLISEIPSTRLSLGWWIKEWLSTVKRAPGRALC